MYESRRQRPLPRKVFALRMATHFAASLALLAASLAAGVWGYMALEGLDALDAFLNAAMLLGGMGPVNPPASAGGKLFAGLYALYAGLIFIVTAALIFGPLVHRMLHRFHWDSAA